MCFSYTLHSAREYLKSSSKVQAPRPMDLPRGNSQCRPNRPHHTWTRPRSYQWRWWNQLVTGWNFIQELLEDIPQGEIRLDLPFDLILRKENIHGRSILCLTQPEASSWQSQWFVPKWHEPFEERPESIQDCTGGWTEGSWGMRNKCTTN